MFPVPPAALGWMPAPGWPVVEVDLSVESPLELARRSWRQAKPQTAGRRFAVLGLAPAATATRRLRAWHRYLTLYSALRNPCRRDDPSTLLQPLGHRILSIKPFKFK
jgi:hypothetical protein